MRRIASWGIAATLLAAVTSAVAADKEPPLDVTAHYGQVHAGQTAVDVALVGRYDPQRSTLHPVVQIAMQQPCAGGDCKTMALSEDFGDPGQLVGLLIAAQKHLAEGTDFTYHLDASPPECSGNPELDLQVDGKARQMQLRLGGHDVQARFDAAQVDAFLGMVQPAFNRLMLVQPQFDAFNAATSLPPITGAFTPACGSAPPAAPTTRS